MAEKKHVLLEIGNTNIKVGICTRDKLLCAYALPTDPGITSDLLGLRLLDVLRHCRVELSELGECAGSSVVPSITPLARRACRRFLEQTICFLGEDIDLPLENHYQTPREVGSDRLVASYAARVLYPEPVSLISVDLGTATTFDCISGNAYLGGLICPGLFSSARNLAASTAKLPQISLELDDSQPLIGLNTATSLNHGFIFGFAAMSEGLIARLKQLLPKPLEVVATGGFSTTLSRVASCFDHVRPDLLLEGLRLSLPLFAGGEKQTENSGEA